MWRNSHPQCESIRPYPWKCRILILEPFTPVQKFTPPDMEASDQFPKMQTHLWKKFTSLDPIHENSLLNIETFIPVKNSHPGESVRLNTWNCRLLIPELFTPVKNFTLMVWKSQINRRECRFLIPATFTPMKKLTPLVLKCQTQFIKIQTSQSRVVHTCTNSNPETTTRVQIAIYSIHKHSSAALKQVCIVMQ